MNHALCRAFLCYAAGLAFILPGATAFAGGFAVTQQSGSGLGNAYAGGAAAADDASTIWSNPAGLVHAWRMDPGAKWQLVTPINVIVSSTRFHDDNSAPALGQPLGGDGGDAGELALVPAIFLARALSQDLYVGVGINAPFGLTTEYDPGWMGRFQATKSSSRTFNLNIAGAYQVAPGLSIGVGVDAARLEAELANSVNYTAAAVQAGLAAGLISPQQVPALLNPANANGLFGLEGSARLKGNDVGFGFNAGVLYEPSAATRIGIHYRSAMDFSVDGSVDFNAPRTSSVLGSSLIAALAAPGMPLASGPARTSIRLPATASFSIVQRVTRAVELLADATWTQWSTIPGLRFVRPDGSELSSVEWNWRDTWRFGVGANWDLANGWLLRLGTAVDQTPIPDNQHRTARLPDERRTWAAAGVRYTLPRAILGSRAAWVDAGISYVRLDTPRIDNRIERSQSASGTLDGSYDSHVWGFSVQLTTTF